MKTGVKKSADKTTGLFFLLCAVSGLFLMAILSFHDSIWYDEVFTLKFIQYPYRQLAALTARDVHPPLYYFIVKFSVDFIHLFSPGLSSIQIAKFSSLLPYLLLFIIIFKTIKKHFGWISAGLSCFLLLFMPNLSSFSIELRMYGWALFFCCSALLSMLSILKNSCRLNWLSFFLFSLAAAYTHYFAAVTVFSLYLSLLLYHIIYNRHELIKWSVSSFLSTLAYLPWLAALSGQLREIREDYWIGSLSYQTFIENINFIFSPHTEFPQAGRLLFFLTLSYCMILLPILLFHVRKNKNKERALPKEGLWFCGTGVFTLIFVILFGFTVSAFFRPVFVDRYMVPAIGCFWIAISCLTGCLLQTRPGRKVKSIIMGILLLSILCSGALDFSYTVRREAGRIKSYKAASEALDAIPDDVILLSDSKHVQAIAGYFYPQASFLWQNTPNPILAELLSLKGPLTSVTELEAFLEQGKELWFLAARPGDFLEDWEHVGIQNKHVGDYKLEGNEFSLYRLFLPPQST